MPDRLTGIPEPVVAPPRSAISNSYCERLDLPVPSVAQVVAKPGVKLFHLMVVTLLEYGEPLPLIAIAERLHAAGVTAATGDMEKSLLKSWHGSKAVYRDDRGFFAPDISTWELRSIIFKLQLRPQKGPSVGAEPEIEPVADEVPLTEQVRHRHQEYEARRTEQRLRDRALAKQLRRAVLRVVPEEGPTGAAALLDIGRREIRSFVGEELLSLSAALDEYNVIAAIGIRESLYALRIRDHERWRLVDLHPPQKTRQLNRAGRKLTLTPELLISGSTGISRPLGDPAKIAEYLAGDRHTKLRRRLESDVKSLLAFYNHGLLHRGIRLRWGFLDEYLSVDWAEPGDLSLHDILEECRNNGTAVDIVTGSAPGWKEPWSRAVRVNIVSFDYTTITVERGDTWTIYRDEVQAIRLAPQTKSPTKDE